MTAPLLTRIRETPSFLRPTAATVLITFLMLILEPLAVAAQNNHPPASAKPSDDGDRRFSATVENIEQHLQRAHDKHSRRQDSSRERSELKRLHQTLKQLDTDERQSFDKIERHLKEHHLPAEILERHREMVEHYDAEQKALTQELNAIEAAGSDVDRNDHVQTALKRLKAKSNKPRHQPLDPKNLPFQVPDGKIRAPKETPDGLRQLLQTQRPTQTTAPALAHVPAVNAPAVAPQPADLEPTEDVQITDDIIALAQSLKNEPVAIYNWVRNSIEYIPTYGSIQGSQLTLTNQKGNAFDTASLLIALYRAAGIPARYVYGTVQIPIDQVMNWVGGVTDPMAALQILGQGGIPNTGMAQGGVIKFVKMEHVWVEAYVDFIPSRGAKHKTGDSWVALDASFKQYDYTPGMNIKTAVPFDTQGLLDRVAQTAQINAADGSITGIDQNLIQTTLDDYKAQVHAYIQQTKTDATVGDVIGKKIIPAQNYPVLAAGLPYQLIQSTGNFAALPDSLRHRISFTLYASSLDQAADNPLFSYSASLPAISAQRVTFAYEPSTAADKAVLDDAFDSYQVRFPAYLVNMTPVIKIEGQRVAGNGSYTVGTQQVFSVEVKTPWYTQPRNYQVTAGDVWALGLNAAGTTPQLFDKRTQAHDLSSGDAPDFIEEMFHQIMLGYWGELNAFKDSIAATGDIIQYQLPSHGFAGAPVGVIYSFGIPRWATYKTRMLDVKENRMTAVHANNDKTQTLSYVSKTGLVTSYLESGIYDQAFLIKPGYSMSAVTALAKANELSIPIYQVTAANLPTVLPKLTVDNAVKNDISNAVNAGLEVLVSRDNVTVADFTGAGYIITDPKTGAGSYRISGGRDGNNSPAGQSVYPLPQVPATPIFGLMMRSALRTAGASLATESGMLIGIVFSPGIAVVAEILGVIIVALMLISAITIALDTLYPKISRKFRHYTNAAFLIYISGQIRQTREGTFGNGIYVADRNDEIINHKVACPPNSVDVATRFQIPRPNDIRPELVTGFVDFEITRDNLYLITNHQNTADQTEYVIRSPLFPGIKYNENNIPIPIWVLYIGPWSIGIDMIDICE